MGQKVEIIHGSTKTEGKIYSVQPITDYNTGGSVVEIILKQKKNQPLFPDDFVKVRITVEEHPKSLSVPETAVVSDGGKNIVFIKKNNGEIKKKEVRLGIREKGYVEILSGLNGNEKIVIKGAYELFHKDIHKFVSVED